jgi:hypothetical protein
MMLFHTIFIKNILSIFKFNLLAINSDYGRQLNTCHTQDLLHDAVCRHRVCCGHSPASLGNVQDKSILKVDGHYFRWCAFRKRLHHPHPPRVLQHHPGLSQGTIGYRCGSFSLGELAPDARIPHHHIFHSYHCNSLPQSRQLLERYILPTNFSSRESRQACGRLKKFCISPN